MQSQRWRFAWFVALGIAVLSGCANLKIAGDTPKFGLPAGGLAASSTAFDPTALDAKSPASAEKEAALTPEQKEQRMIESQFALARLCERRGENDDAAQIYNTLLEKIPNDPRPHHRLGVLAVQAGNFAKAEECFGKSQSLAPPTPELLSDIGYCYYLQHRLPEAEGALREALRLQPTHSAATNNLALVLGRQGRFQESMELFKRTGNEAEAYANLAYVLAQNGQLAQAKEMYLRALTLDNRMRAAAQAMLQVNDRAEMQDRLAAMNRQPPATAVSMNEPNAALQPMGPLQQ
jgi:Flp pilus assembly protein TadD